MFRSFTAVAPTAAELVAARPGDGIVAQADVVMDRAFTVNAATEVVWPWLAQLGKGRAGWYLPRAVERFVPHARRAARAVLPGWQQLRVGDVIPDYGGPKATFEVAIVAAPTNLVYRSRRGRMNITWAITLTASPAAGPATGTRIHLRLRLGPVRRRWLAESLGDVVDLLSIAAMSAGLQERLEVT